MDKIDRQLLASLQEDASLSHAEIAERINLSPSQCSRRLQRLQQEGFIVRQVSILNEAKLGLHVEAYVMVALTTHVAGAAASFRQRMAHINEVVDFCSLTGDVDYLLHIITKSLTTFTELINEHILGKGDVASVRSSIVLERIKRSTALPLM
ncbi:Lrp/AsnC family transcriptional regulator [Rhodanobacter sp. PCA2]|uniref:Lrp/AsnC family transcriptional regulator n=1 Tax=Rhodanobacter sp. PCA2 TaxID=2006117 RepID=UPI0015E78310|nr:Lrp/AsnC family transcriptional regulator [Rhodanobacter sp. PCA2]MBA2078007.1 AsnC family transcriptional regulator [Rhodanobacter sp. PCA2]